MKASLQLRPLFDGKQGIFMASLKAPGPRLQVSLRDLPDTLFFTPRHRAAHARHAQNGGAIDPGNSPLSEPVLWA